MKLVSLLLCCLGIGANAQISFGKPQPENKAILDFAFFETVIEEEDNPDLPNEQGVQLANKAIILPIVDISGSESVYTPGTFLMDKNDKKIKIFVDNEWLLLTDEGSFDVQINEDIGEGISTEVEFNTSAESGAGVLIGDRNEEGNVTSSAEGVLVLESLDKALILPYVPNPHINISSPIAGTMCYDTVSNSLAVFDGVVWSYWK